MEETRSELWAGIVIIFAVILVVSMVITVGKYTDLLKERKDIVVYLAKVDGIRINDPVRYAGMEVGQVTGVEYDEKNAKLKVAMKILSDTVLRDDTTATVVVSMMGISSVEISPGSGKPIKAGEGPSEIKGVASSSLQDVADKAGKFIDRLNNTFGEEQQKDLQEIIKNIKETTHNAKELFAKITAIVDENREDIRSLVKYLDKTAASLDEITSENKDNIAKTIQDIRKASARLEPLFTRLEAAVKDVNDAVAGAKKFVGSANLLLDENRRNIDDIVRNVKDVTANLQLMSQDLRMHPWKLLNKETEKEIVSGDVAYSLDKMSLLEKELDGQIEQLLAMQQKVSPGNPQLMAILSNLKEIVELMRRNQESVRSVLSEAPAKK